MSTESLHDDESAMAQNESKEVRFRRAFGNLILGKEIDPSDLALVEHISPEDIEKAKEQARQKKLHAQADFKTALWLKATGQELSAEQEQLVAGVTDDELGLIIEGLKKPTLNTPSVDNFKLMKARPYISVTISKS